MEIGFLLYANSAEPDIAGPHQWLARLPGARIHLVAESDDNVLTDCGCSLTPTARFSDALDLDMICVPGGSGVAGALESPALLDFLCDTADRTDWIAAVGTGAFVLGGAGLLVGRRATTHSAYAGLLAEVGAVYRPDRVVRDGNVLTCTDASAAGELASALAEAMAGDGAAAGLRDMARGDPGTEMAPCTCAGDNASHALDRRKDYGAHVGALREALGSNTLGFEYTL